MKLPKSLIQAVFIGVTMVGASSCGLHDSTLDEQEEEITTRDSETDTCDVNGTPWDNCPACGMG